MHNFYYKMPVKRNRTNDFGLKSNKRQRKTKRTRALASDKVHVHRKTYGFQIVGNATYNPYSGSIGPMLSAVNGNTDLANLYDQYRIDECEVKLFLAVDPSAQTATTAIWPKVYSTRDQDDLTALTQAQMYERSNMRIDVLDPARPVVWKFKPNCLDLVYRGVGTSSVNPSFGQWIDMTTIDVQHYGINFNIDNLTNTALKVDVLVTLTVSCKVSR